MDTDRPRCPRRLPGLSALPSSGRGPSAPSRLCSERQSRAVPCPRSRPPPRERRFQTGAAAGSPSLRDSPALRAAAISSHAVHSGPALPPPAAIFQPPPPPPRAVLIVRPRPPGPAPRPLPLPPIGGRRCQSHTPPAPRSPRPRPAPLLHGDWTMEPSVKSRWPMGAGNARSRPQTGGPLAPPRGRRAAVRGARALRGRSRPGHPGGHGNAESRNHRVSEAGKEL